MKAANTKSISRGARRPDPVCLYSVKEVVERCGLSQKTIRRHIEKGLLRIQRVGHAIRISHEELLLFLRLPPRPAPVTANVQQSQSTREVPSILHVL
ncbi:MAG: helix-turn-helix domain-containing protein [Rhizomicrobium sp.]